MRAAVRQRFGAPDVVQVREVEQPELTDDGVLVRVRAASLNRGDWYGVTCTPYVGRPQMGLRGPKDTRLGTDFAGTVEAVGRDVTGVQPGDDVFGGRSGALAELVCARKGYAKMPANVSFEEAAAVPVAALTALQALRDKGRLQPGQRVLVNGASGGVGTFTVQIAKALGAAAVTGVCRSGNVELVRSLGADHVVDYTREDFAKSGRRYDLIVDVAGDRSWRDYARVLERDGTLVLVGGPMHRVLGPLGHIGRMLAGGLIRRRNVVFFIAKFNKPDMETLRELVESGRVKPIVERSYELGEIAEAIRYLGEGHPHGKVVVTV